MKNLLAFLLFVISLTGYSQQITYEFPGASAAASFGNLQSVSGNKYVAAVNGINGNHIGLCLFDQSFNPIWVKEFDLTSTGSGSANDGAMVAGECMGGGYFLFGESSNTMTGAAYYLIKTDVNGAPVWSKNYEYAGAAYSQATTIDQTATGEFYLTCSYSSAMTIMKVDINGDFLWGKQITEDTLSSLKNPGFDSRVMADGGIITSGKRDNDRCFARFSSNGTLMWTKVYANSGTYNQPRTIINLADGNLLVGGLQDSDGYLLKMDGNGNTIWRKKYTFGSFTYGMAIDEIVEFSNGHIGAISNGFGAMAFTVFDASGNLINSRLVGNTMVGTLYGKTIATQNGKLTFCGQFQNNTGNHATLMVTDNNLGFECFDIAFPVVTDNSPVNETTLNNSLQIKNFGSSSNNTVTATNITITKEDFCPLVLSSLAAPTPVFAYSVFPNPVAQNNLVTVQLTDVTENMVMEVFDAVGRKIHSAQIVPGQTLVHFQMNTSGMYLLNLRNNEGKILATEKVICE